MAQAAPELMALHKMAPDQVDECRLLLLQSFANVTLQSNAWVPDYEAWLYETDFAPVYRRYRQNLQLIGLGDDARWVLKDPSHLWAPEALLEIFPDAAVIQTHRHPRELIPSVSALVHASRSLYDPAVQKAQVGRQQLQQWARVLNNMTAVRRKRPEVRICDVHMAELRHSPAATLERIYRELGLPDDDTLKSRRRQVASGQSVADLPATPRDAEAFGLNTAQIDEAFAEYIEAHHLADPPDPVD